VERMTVEDAVRRQTGRPRLLFLCQTLPFPPDGGVWIRTYHVLRLLARAFDVTALCFERASASGGAMAQDAARSALQQLADVEVFELPQRHSRARFLWDHTRSVLLGRVYTRYLYESRSFAARLRGLLQSTRFDLVHADSMDLARYFPVHDDLPIVCVHHDVESELLGRRASLEHSPWRRAYVRHQSRLMRQVERRWCPRVALNVVTSDRDRALLAEVAPGSRIDVVPNGVDTDEYLPGSRVASPTDALTVAYVGGTAPFPNFDALEFFSREILPHLRSAVPHASARWIGRASASQQQHYREEYGIELTGYVDDTKPLMREAACHVVPLRVGGGTRLKILNAWALGKAVVSTSIGCEGLAAVDGENILIRDEPRAFAEAIATVLRDCELRRRLGEHGRATAERRYSWDAIGPQMIRAYSALITRGSRQPIPASASVMPRIEYEHS
jgi:glycosyltransferase involved in cell wall biosynthesis